jgi:cell division protein FtsB
MRRPARNIEIFSMSVLDMFASALGAFILMAVILFPYYQKNRPIKQKLDAAVAELKRTQEDVDKTKAQGQKLEQQNNELKGEIQKVQLAQVELNQCRQGNSACLIQLRKTFLLVKIEWSTTDDVDLHIKDPQGNDFSWDKPNRNGRDFPNTKARLSTDTAIGPGVEIWQAPAVETGAYQIDYVVNKEPTADITVTGFFFDKTGKKPLPDRVLKKGQQRVTAGVIEIGADAGLTLR